MNKHNARKTEVLLQCLGEDDGEDDENSHSTDCTNNDHLLQRGRQRETKGEQC